MQEDLEVDRVEAALPGQLQLGGLLQHLAVQHLGVEAGTGLHEGAPEAGYPLVEAHGSHVQQLGTGRRGEGHGPASDDVSQPVRCSSRA